MPGEALTIAEVASELGLSERSVRRLIEAKKLRFFKPGGHYRVRRSDLEIFRTERQATSAGGPSPVLRNRRERLEELTLDAQELKAKRELKKLKAEEAEEEAERSAAAEAEQQEREQRRREQEQRNHQEREEKRRQKWLGMCYDFALSVLPAEASEAIKLDVCRQVRQALAEHDPDETPAIIETVVVAAVKRVLEPWNREREAQIRLTWLDKQTSEAWDRLRSVCSSECLAAVDHDHNPEALREALAQAISSVMQVLSPGSSWGDLEKARQRAIDRVLEPYRRKRKTQSAIQSALAVVKPHLRTRRDEGLLPPHFDSQDLELLARLIEPRLRVHLEAELRNREFSDAEAQQLARDFIDTDQRLI